MSYTPHTWTVGDVITAERLNALEQAVAGASGYDAEVYIYHSGSTADSYVGTIVSGDFATLSAMIADDTPPNILVRLWDELIINKFSHSAVAIYYAGNDYINFDAGYMTAYGFEAFSRVAFTWNSDDTLEVTVYVD